MFAVQNANGSYLPERRELTDDDIDEHLAGLWSIGTYTTLPVENTVKYVVFDLDTHDEGATNALCYLVGELAATSIGHKKCLFREWSGNKGTHCWVFFGGQVPAAKVRRWIERDFSPKWKALGFPQLEVFPKNDSVEEGGFGNLVKLPFGKHAVSGQWSVPVAQTGWASNIEDVIPFPAALVPDIAPVSTSRVQPGTGQAGPGNSGPGLSTPFPCMTMLLNEGAPEGYRDRAMYMLALYWRSYGLEQDLALDQCLRTNELFDPPLTVSEVTTKVRSAYRGNQRGASCKSQDWLRDVCPGPCDTVPRFTSSGSLLRAHEGGTVELEVASRTYTEGRTRLTLTHPDMQNTPTAILKEATN